MIRQIILLITTIIIAVYLILYSDIFEFDFSNYVFDVENDNLSIIFDSANNDCEQSIGEILYGNINIDNLLLEYVPFPNIFIEENNCLENLSFKVFDGIGLSDEQWKELESSCKKLGFGDLFDKVFKMKKDYDGGK